ncbi:DUF4270 domain-containing protein [Flavobacterium seoulense]|uniref:DUF4270 domain-containing protein n=1 Tax=Flavobacterium seoulense TaxID=1492738 RepID=A0A066X0Z0_9FLAO|nr:DUF4270 domain-containing protein [Flavobacterium seoulense]KDN56590.1 hypothetical protein FEM21_00930 [Flavobacterium seoulense]
MRNNSFFKIIILILGVVFFTSCDKDFNTIGDNLIGNEHFGLESKSFNVLSYNQKIGPVQSNNLPINALGVYEDPVFGTTEASFVTQVVLASPNPVIGANPEIESVILYVPYLVKSTTTDATTGDNTYVLDSIYGPETGKIKLSIYENGYFMRDLDPLTGFLERQKFYTNQASEFEGLKKPVLLNNDTSETQNTAFFFDKTEFKETTPATTTGGEPTITRTPPGMRLALNKAHFKTAIIDAVTSGSGKLATNDVFKNHFRGLYFKVEKSGTNPGSMALMDFSKGTITIKYKEDSSTTPVERVERSIVLNLTGNTVNLLSNTNKPDYDTAVNNPNTTAGDEKLYLKGGEGAMAVLDLFDKKDDIGYNDKGEIVVGANNIPDELDDLRNPANKKKLLINEANLVFHVDGDVMGTNKLPIRMYLYDFNNRRPILDYVSDGTTGGLVYGGLLNATKVSDKTYKFRITNHIRNLINNKDSTNVKLGIVVSNDIANTNSTMNNLRSPLSNFSQVPQVSLTNPRGVIFHGGKSSVPAEKRLKLEIYYTKPN